MSLVSEALKKAERAAAAREARGKGQPAPFEAPLQPYRSRRGGRSRGSVLAILAGVGLVVALGLGWWSSARKAPVKGVGAERSEELAVPASTGPADGNSAAAPAPQPQALPVAGVEAARTLAPPSVSEPPPTTLATPPLPNTTPSPSPAPPSASEPPAPKPAALPLPKALPNPSPAATTVLGPGDYLRRADFSDGTSLELGGIVYSAASPFAYINGRLVGVGEFVLGRRIDRIERDRVILSGDAGTITLRLKAN